MDWTWGNSARCKSLAWGRGRHCWRMGAGYVREPKPLTAPLAVQRVSVRGSFQNFIYSQQPADYTRELYLSLDFRIQPLLGVLFDD